MTGVYHVTTPDGHRELAFWDGSRYATASCTYPPGAVTNPRRVNVGWASLYHLQQHRREILDTAAAGDRTVIIRNRKPVAVIAPLTIIEGDDL